ncbi:MAG TPA: CPBP family intramembrane metalloprotease [Acetobacteraceae bacterium]|nr:CPBP family intramembrane metalloprotease [Acetobacteraceae bacterium]
MTIPPIGPPVAPRMARLWFEWLIIYAAGPVLILITRKPGALFFLLWLGALIGARASRVVSGPPDLRTILRRVALFAPFKIGLVLMAVTALKTAADDQRHAELRSIIRRFVLYGLLLAFASRLLSPSHFLDLPRHRPILWLAIMLLYPLLSVWPQEMIYRQLLFRRYGALFSDRWSVILASAIAFGFAHIIFRNPVAVLLTLIGGLLFAHSYDRHRSLGLVWFEHSLYGCLIFTIGLGRFFFRA